MFGNKRFTSDYYKNEWTFEYHNINFVCVLAIAYQNSSMGFVIQFVKIEYIFKIKKYCIIWKLSI